MGVGLFIIIAIIVLILLVSKKQIYASFFFFFFLKNIKICAGYCVYQRCCKKKSSGAVGAAGAADKPRYEKCEFP